MDVVFILISWLILLIPGFDDSVPVTSDKIFKIETSPDMVQSITTRSDESLDFLGFDIELKQNSTGVLEIKIPKNLPTPASFTNSWHHGGNPIMLTDGIEIGYDAIPNPCYFHYKIHVKGETNLEILYPVILTGSWQLYSPTQFDESHSCYDKVFYEKPLESPLKQFNSGVPSDEIQCNDLLVLVTKNNGFPACLKPESIPKLAERGWIFEMAEWNQRSGSWTIENGMYVPTVVILQGATLEKNQSLSPEEITIIREKNNTVTWINGDDVAHTLVSDDKDNPWWTGLMKPGESSSVKFNSTGIFSYHGMPGPWITGTVIVIPDAYDEIILPPSSDYDFEKMHMSNACTEERSFCFGVFENGTQVMVQCDFPIHGCGPIYFDDYREINEN